MALRPRSDPITNIWTVNRWRVGEIS